MKKARLIQFGVAASLLLAGALSTRAARATLGWCPVPMSAPSDECNPPLQTWGTSCSRGYGSPPSTVTTGGNEMAVNLTAASGYFCVQGVGYSNVLAFVCEEYDNTADGNSQVDTGCAGSSFYQGVFYYSF
jgi:hypothetical protein